MTANERQVGGNHYKHGDEPEHWDLAIMYSWDCFQYQITKYVMRWKEKHTTFDERLDDLRKARHFLDKYIENAERYDTKAAKLKMLRDFEEAEGGPTPNYVDQDHEERLPGCLDDTPCLQPSYEIHGTVLLRPDGPRVPDTGRQRQRRQ